MVQATQEHCTAMGCAEEVFAKATLTADSGYHSKQSMEYIAASGLDAYVADRDRRRRDPAFANAGRSSGRQNTHSNGCGADLEARSATATCAACLLAAKTRTQPLQCPSQPPKYERHCGGACFCLEKMHGNACGGDLAAR